MFFRNKENNKPKHDYVVKEIKAPEGTELGPVFAAHPPSLHLTCEYEDNEIVCQELRVSLLPSDWCRFEKQEFYRELIEWVRRLENSDIPHNIDHPDTETD